MKSVDEVIERVKRIKFLKTDTDLARYFAIKPNTVSNWRKRRTIPYKILFTFCEKEKVSLNWLLSNENTDALGKGSLSTKVDGGASGHVEVDVYPSAGVDTLKKLGEQSPVESIVVPKFLYQPSHLVLRVTGKSMEPTIMDGAHAGIDRSSSELVSGKLFALFIPREGIMVKRLYVDVWKITMRSDNALFPYLSIPFEEIPAEDFILGEVKWVIQSF